MSMCRPKVIHERACLLQDDGWLDALIGNGDGKGLAKGAPNELHHNNQDGTFTQQTSTANFPFLHDQNTHAVAFARWSVGPEDGLGLLVGNKNQPNELYRNVNGVFTLVASTMAVDATSPTSSIAWGDFDVSVRPFSP